MTVCTRLRKRNTLCKISVGGGLCAAPEVELTEIGAIIDQAVRDIPIHNPGVEVDTYCLMPDHIHLVVTWTGRHGDRPLQDIIGRMKSYTDRYYAGQLWQESFYDHILRNPDDLAQTRQYIENNPALWAGEKD